MTRPRALALLVAQAAAVWPVWRWVAARVGDGSGDGAALAACAAALLLRPAGAGDDREAPYPYRRSAGLLLAYAVCAVAAPPLAAAAVAFVALLVAWSAWRWGASPHPAGVGLILLALPALPTAQFLLGYPLRVLTGAVAARLLGLGGFAVERRGAVLAWGGRVIAVDAPCSGVHLLWTALLLAFALAALARLDRRRTAALVGLASLLAVAGNGLRAAALFFPESGLVTLPPGGHAGVGVIVFALAAAPLVWTSRRFAS